MATVNNLDLEFEGEGAVIPVTVRGNITFTTSEIRARTGFRLSVELMPSDVGDQNSPSPISGIPPEQPIHTFIFSRPLFSRPPGFGQRPPVIIRQASLFVTAQDSPYEFETTNFISLIEMDEDTNIEFEIDERPNPNPDSPPEIWVTTFTAEDEVYAQALLSLSRGGVAVSPVLAVPGSRQQIGLPTIS